MDPITLSALISAGISLIGAIITNISNRRNVSNTNATNLQSVQQTNQANSLLAQQQHTWNVQDWQMQADWESPQHQMQMFRDAGLNSNLIYGQMSDSPSINSTSPNPMQANKAIPFLAENPMQGLDPLMLARLDNIKANTELTEAQAETENNLREYRVQNLIAATENLSKQNEGIEAEIKRKAKENEFTDAQIKQFKFDNVMRGKYLRLDSERFKMQSRLTDAQIRNLDADRRKKLAEAKVTEREYDEMIWTYSIRKSGLVNQVNLSAAQIAQAKATAAKLGVETEIEEWTAEGKREMTSWIKGQKGILPQFVGCTLWLCEDVISSFGSIIK